MTLQPPLRRACRRRSFSAKRQRRERRWILTNPQEAPAGPLSAVAVDLSEPDAPATVVVAERQDEPLPWQAAAVPEDNSPLRAWKKNSRRIWRRVALSVIARSPRLP